MTLANWVMRSGFHFKLRRVDREEMEEHILVANQDSNVDGIMVYYVRHILPQL